MTWLMWYSLGLLTAVPVLAVAALAVKWSERDAGAEPQETAGDIELYDRKEIPT